MRSTTIVLAFALALCVGGAVSQYEDFEYGYDEYYDEYNYGGWYEEDEYDMAEGDYDLYGYDEEYGGYGDDEYGYEGYGGYDYGYGEDYPQDYYMDYDYFDEAPDCEVADDGSVTMLGIEACDLAISGGDSMVNKLSEGIDGHYKVVGCHDGRPMYKRTGKAERLLWYSALYKDWDFNEGGVVVESDILGYGGDGLSEERPQFVPRDKWNLLGEYSSAPGDEFKDFITLTLDMKCADGTEVAPSKPTASSPQFGAHPLLTDDEWEAKYAQIYNRYTRKEPKINTMFVAIIVLAGVGIVLGIPYLVYFKKNPRSKAYSLLNHGRKAVAGHKH